MVRAFVACCAKGPRIEITFDQLRETLSAHPTENEYHSLELGKVKGAKGEDRYHYSLFALKQVQNSLPVQPTSYENDQYSLMALKYIIHIGVYI